MQIKLKIDHCRQKCNVALSVVQINNLAHNLKTSDKKVK